MPIQQRVHVSIYSKKKNEKRIEKKLCPSAKLTLMMRSRSLFLDQHYPESIGVTKVDTTDEQSLLGPLTGGGGGQISHFKFKKMPMSHVTIFAIFMSILESTNVELRDWSLITGRGGGYKMGKSRIRNFLCPPPRQGKTFRAPPFKEWKLFVTPYNMAKTSSYHVKTTPELFVPPPSAWLKLFLPPPPFRRGKTSSAPPLPFCSPPPSP